MRGILVKSMPLYILFIYKSIEDMRNYISFLLVLYLLFVIACSPSQKKGSFDFESVDTLKHVKTYLDEHIWGHPMSISYLDSMLLVADERADIGLLHLIDCHDMTSVLDFGTKGQGRNEFLMPFDFQMLNDTTLTLFDLANRSLYSLNLREIINGIYEFPVCYKDTVPGTIKILPTKYDTFVTLGFYENCMMKLQGKGMDTKLYGEYPYRDDDERKIENRLRGMAYQGVFRSNLSKDKFVYAANSADILYFYNITPEDISIVCKYEYNYPEYMTRVQGDSRATPMSPTNNRTFVDVATSDKYVYLLYSGRNFKEVGLKAFEGSTIYVFDWEGNPIQKYILDIPITYLCVNPKDTELFAFSNMPEPTLVKFDL